jgi:LPXTG-motif cell wall-anchored protein
MQILRAFTATFAVAMVTVVWWMSLVKTGDTPEEAAIWVGGFVALSLLAAYFAQQRRNRSFYKWLVVSLMFTPVLGFVLAACSRTLPEAA